MKINDFEYETKTLDACPVCGSKEYAHHYKMDYFGVEVNYMICHKCSARFQLEQMSDECTHDYYAYHYRKFLEINTKHTREADVQTQQLRAHHFVSILKSMDVKPRSHLDVGASLGFMVEQFNRAFGCNSYGTEWDEIDREICKNKGLKVTDTYPNIRVDIITMAHVLEHMNNPVDELLKLQTMLNEDGRIMIEVPNGDANIHAYLLHHPIAYTPQAMVTLLDRVGLTLENGVLHAAPFNSPLSAFLTVVAK